MINAVMTERLIVRRPEETDLHDFLAYRNDAENLKFQPIIPINKNAAVHFLKKQMLIEDETASGWIMFAIALKHEKKMIGEVGIYISSDRKSNGDLGWSFHKDYQGNGYALEAAEVILKYAFKLRKLGKVTATCVSTNTASLRLMKRLGMHREVGRTNNQFIDGIRYDEYLYTLSSEDWLALN